MAERLGLLFADGSMTIMPERTDVQTARQEAAEHDDGDFGPKTRIVRLKIEIIAEIS
jgi:hypothetical protein